MLASYDRDNLPEKFENIYDKLKTIENDLGELSKL